MTNMKRLSKTFMKLCSSSVKNILKFTRVLENGKKYYRKIFCLVLNTIHNCSDVAMVAPHAPCKISAVGLSIYTILGSLGGYLVTQQQLAVYHVTDSMLQPVGPAAGRFLRPLPGPGPTSRYCSVWQTVPRSEPTEGGLFSQHERRRHD